MALMFFSFNRKTEETFEVTKTIEDFEVGEAEKESAVPIQIEESKLILENKLEQGLKVESVNRRNTGGKEAVRKKKTSKKGYGYPKSSFTFEAFIKSQKTSDFAGRIKSAKKKKGFSSSRELVSFTGFYQGYLVSENGSRLLFRMLLTAGSEDSFFETNCFSLSDEYEARRIVYGSIIGRNMEIYQMPDPNHIFVKIKDKSEYYVEGYNEWPPKVGNEKMIFRLYKKVGEEIKYIGAPKIMKDPGMVPIYDFC